MANFKFKHVKYEVVTKSVQLLAENDHNRLKNLKADEDNQNAEEEMVNIS